MKKVGYTFLLTTFMMASAASNCFANDAPDNITDFAKPVVFDHEYSQLGIKTHSWITGTGANTVAHTQTIDMTSGNAINQIDRQCGYIDSSSTN